MPMFVCFQMAYQGKFAPKNNPLMKTHLHKHVGWGHSLFTWEQARGELQVKLPKETVAVYTTMITPQGRYTAKLNMGEWRMRTSFRSWGNRKPTYLEEKALNTLPEGSIPPPIPSYITHHEQYPEHSKFPDLQRYRPRNLQEMGVSSSTTAEVHTCFNYGPREGFHPHSPILIEEDGLGDPQPDRKEDQDNHPPVKTRGLPALSQPTCQDVRHKKNYPTCQDVRHKRPTTLTLAENHHQTTDIPPTPVKTKDLQETIFKSKGAIISTPAARAPVKPPRKTEEKGAKPAPSIAEAKKQLALLEEMMEILQQQQQDPPPQKKNHPVIHTPPVSPPCPSSDSSTLEPEGIPDLIQLEISESEEEEEEEKEAAEEAQPRGAIFRRRRWISPTRRPPTPGATEASRREELYQPGSPIYTPSSPTYAPRTPSPARETTPFQDPWMES